MASRAFYLPTGTGRDKAMSRLAGFLARLASDKRWTVEVSEFKPVRSDSQNRFLWGVVYDSILKAGKLEGWTSEDLHEYLLGEHFGWEIVEGFGKKRHRPIRHSSKLNKQEFSDYVAFIQQRMAEHGIYIPDPGDGTD